MKEASLHEGISALLAAFPGVLGCALVDAASGLVWYRHSDRAHDGLWEASIDHWRLHGRLGAHFDALGSLGAIVAYHREGTLALSPCVREPEVLLVCLARHGEVDWLDWQREAQRLGNRIRTAFEPVPI
ncbi:MAG TPA: hypothetical protein VH328_03425 [Burkholderiaceae bacterium]|nr:hypothetical protein [Burkholderiaceae bacterium]